MGFDTYLNLDDKMIMSWRKSANYLPRLLFRHGDFEISCNDLDKADLPRVEVKFRATVSQVLENLESSGLGWHAAVAAYSDLPKQAWQRLSAGTGAKGFRYHDWAFFVLPSPLTSTQDFTGY